MIIFYTVPIDSPDLGDDPLRGVNFLRRACAGQRAFYALSRMLQIGTNALFRIRNCSSRGCKEKNARNSQFLL